MKEKSIYSMMISPRQIAPRRRSNTECALSREHHLRLLAALGRVNIIPAASKPEGINWPVLNQLGDEIPRCIGVVPFVKIALNEAKRLLLIYVQRWNSPLRLRFLRFLLERHDEARIIELYDTDPPPQSGILDSIRCDHVRIFFLKELHEVPQIEIEQIVACEDHKIIGDTSLAYGKADISDGPQAILVGRGPIVDDRHWFTASVVIRPLLESRSKSGVGHDIHMIHGIDQLDLVQ